MTYQKSSLQQQNYSLISEEKFEKIIDAILDGKYSWACVLMLETVGYNPLHYIPYRTYNRLIKNNCIGAQSKYRQTTKSTQKSSVKTAKTPQTNTQIKDLTYVETAHKNKVRGGNKIAHTTTELDSLTILVS